MYNICYYHADLHCTRIMNIIIVRCTPRDEHRANECRARVVRYHRYLWIYDQRKRAVRTPTTNISACRIIMTTDLWITINSSSVRKIIFLTACKSKQTFSPLHDCRIVEWQVCTSRSSKCHSGLKRGLHLIGAILRIFAMISWSHSSPTAIILGSDIPKNG